jgi:cold shock protein
MLWNNEEGWGALAAPEVSGEVWAHFADIEMDGYRSLSLGQAVCFRYETPGQDGYPHRAIDIRPR